MWISKKKLFLIEIEKILLKRRNTELLQEVKYYKEQNDIGNKMISDVVKENPLATPTKCPCDFEDKKELEIARLNDRIEGMAKDNLNLLNSKLMLRKQNRIYKNEIVELKKRISKLESELNLVI